VNARSPRIGPLGRETLSAIGWTFLALTSAAQLSAASRAAQGVPPPSAAVPTISWTWVTIKPSPGQPRGYVQFERDCVVCHGSGPAKPGTRALHTKYAGHEPALLAERRDLAPEYVRSVVRHGVYVMPPFRKTELSDADLDAIVAYLTRNNPATH
jgi:(+)-pinoresinol hydroxylase